MQEVLQGRLLVDKTPSYTLDPATLLKAERDFDLRTNVAELRQYFKASVRPYSVMEAAE